MSTKIKYRLIKSPDNIIVILEDGGVADIRDVEELDEGDGRQATTEYYKERFTLAGIASDDGIFGEVGEGDMYYNDWKDAFDAPKHIVDALEWLAPGLQHEEDNSIWSELQGEHI